MKGEARLITRRSRLCRDRVLRRQKLQAGVVALIKPFVQGRGLPGRRVVKREVALVGWFQPVRVKGQDRGYQPCLVAAEDVNEIAAGQKVRKPQNVLAGGQYLPIHGDGLGYRNYGFLVRLAGFQRRDKRAAHQAHGQGSENGQIAFHSCVSSLLKMRNKEEPEVK